MTRATPGAVLAALSGQDRVVVIRRPLVDWLGCDVQARLLDQCLYEADKAGGDWFAVTDAEWCDRLLVAQHKLAPARVALVARGLLETDRRGIPARLFYRMDTENVFAAFADWLGSRELVLAPPITGDAPAQNRRRARAEHSIQDGFKDGEGKESPDSAPTDAAGDVPTATPDADAWLPVKAAISAMFSGLAVTDAKGKLKPAVGNALRIIGKAADDDPARALAILARFNASKDREYCNRLSALPEAIGSWLGKHPSQAGPMVVGAGGAATLNGHARYAFRTSAGRLAMKAIPVLKAEGLAPDDADPFDRGTWTPAMLEAEAAIMAVAG